MYVMYHDLRQRTGIETAVPTLGICRKAISSLGSSAWLAIHGLLDEYQSPDCCDRFGLSMKRLTKPTSDNKIQSMKMAEAARTQLMDYVRNHTKLREHPGEALPEDTKTFGNDAPTKSAISLQDLVGILSTIGRDLTGSEPVKSPWAGGPAQDRHAAAKAAVQKGSFPTGPGEDTGKYTEGQFPKGSFPTGPAPSSGAEEMAEVKTEKRRSPSRSNKIPKRSDWKPSLRYD